MEGAIIHDLQATTCLTLIINISYNSQTQIMKDMTSFLKQIDFLTLITHHENHKITFKNL